MFSLHKVKKCDRVPVSQILNQRNWDAGFKAGFPLWEKGEKERKAGNIETAINLFNEARNNGYLAPALYHSYAKAYRKLKDLDNEIAILEEGIPRLKAAKFGDNEDLCRQLQKAKAKKEVTL